MRVAFAPRMKRSQPWRAAEPETLIRAPITPAHSDVLTRFIMLLIATGYAMLRRIELMRAFASGASLRP
jgi:hypothetical protein